MPLLTRRTLLLSAAGSAVAAWPACANPLSVAPPDAAADQRELMLINRATWGAQHGALAALQRQGPRDWLRQQLKPEADPLAGLPGPVQEAIAALPVSRTPLPTLVRQLDQRRRDAESLPEGEGRQAAYRAYRQQLTHLGAEASHRLLLRAVHAPQQLQERLTSFWCNHFSVFEHKGLLRAMVGDYEQHTIRPLALGRFEDLLIACTTHPAMLRMLDNDRNALGHLNENHARELMELHTLGVDGGYTQQDVQALARILTGLGVRLAAEPARMRPALQDHYVQQGLMEFHPARHDFEPKTWLGLHVAGRGWPEILQALQHLAQHPATARFISTKLARHFIADGPTPAVVQAMTARFLATQGHIGQTLRVMFEAPAVQALPLAKFKDPMRWVLSSVRLAHEGVPITNAAPLLRWLQRLGQAPFNHTTPEGYPDQQADWAGSGQLQTRFELARSISTARARLLQPFEDDEGANAPPEPIAMSTTTTPDGDPIALMTPLLAPRTRDALAQARNPQARIALLLSAPEFMQC